MRTMHAAGLAVTVPRLAVWMVLARSDEPLHAADIQRRLIERGVGVPLSSTYAALKRLTTAGLVTSHAFSDNKARFGLANRMTRNRLTCLETGDEHWLDDAQFTHGIAALCRSHGFELHDYTLSIQARRMTNAPGGRGVDRRTPRRPDSKGQVPLRQGDADHEDEVPAMLSGSG